MKILFLTRRFYPDIGGVEKHVFEIGSRLVKKGYKATIITESQSSEKISQKKPISQIRDINKTEGMEVYRIFVGKDDWFKKFRIWKSLWGLRNLIKEANVVHCHDVFFWYLPFRFLFPNKSVYTTFHGYEGYPIKKRIILVRKISEILSWGNICIGEFIKKWYHTKSTFISYGAVDSSKFKVQISKFKKDSAIFIGRLEENTGILDYVKSIDILKKEYSGFEFVVVGDGNLRKRIEGKTSLTGFQQNPEKYLQKCHFVFASGYLSILEAFAARKLVFSVFDNALKEDYLKLTPFSTLMVIENSPEKLAKRIKYFLVNPQIEKELTDKAYKWVENQTWDKVVNIYLSLWKAK